MAQGESGFLGISAQQSFGTAATGSLEFVKFISESITTDVEQLLDEGICKSFDEQGYFEGLETNAGDIVVDTQATTFGHFLKGVCGQSSLTTTGATSGTIFSHSFVPKNSDFDGKAALPPYTCEVNRDQSNSFEFTDLEMSALSIDISPSAFVRSTVTVLTRTASLMTASTPSFITEDPFIWHQASLSLGGSALSIAENVNVTLDNVLEGVQFLDATKRHAKYKRSGLRTVRVSGTLDFEDETEYGIFKDQIQQRLLINLDDISVASSTNTLLIDVPQLRYSSFPINIGGPGRITVGFEGNGVVDTSSSYAVQYTLTNSRSIGY